MDLWTGDSSRGVRVGVCSAATANQNTRRTHRALSSIQLIPCGFWEKKARSLVCVRRDVVRGLVRRRRRVGAMETSKTNKQNLHHFTAAVLCGTHPWLRLNKCVYRLVPAVIAAPTEQLIQGEDK